MAGLQWGECRGDKQQTSKSQKTYHNTTVWRGNQSTKLAEVSNLAHQTEEAVQNSNKNKQRQGEEQEKDRTAGQEFQETWQEHQEEVFGLDTSQSFRRTLDVTMETLGKPVVLKTCGTNHDITGQLAKVDTWKCWPKEGRQT